MHDQVETSISWLVEVRLSVFLFSTLPRLAMHKNDCAGDPDSTEVLEEGSRSILLSLASQLRKGMDLVSCNPAI